MKFDDFHSSVMEFADQMSRLGWNAKTKAPSMLG